MRTRLAFAVGGIATLATLAPPIVRGEEAVEIRIDLEESSWKPPTRDNAGRRLAIRATTDAPEGAILRARLLWRGAPVFGVADAEGRARGGALEIEFAPEFEIDRALVYHLLFEIETWNQSSEVAIRLPENRTLRAIRRLDLWSGADRPLRGPQEAIELTRALDAATSLEARLTLAEAGGAEPAAKAELLGGLAELRSAVAGVPRLRPGPFAVLFERLGDALATRIRAAGPLAPGADSGPPGTRADRTGDPDPPGRIPPPPDPPAAVPPEFSMEPVFDPRELAAIARASLAEIRSVLSPPASDEDPLAPHIERATALLDDISAAGAKSEAWRREKERLAERIRDWSLGSWRTSHRAGEFQPSLWSNAGAVADDLWEIHSILDLVEIPHGSPFSSADRDAVDAIAVRIRNALAGMARAGD